MVHPLAHLGRAGAGAKLEPVRVTAFSSREGEEFAYVLEGEFETGVHRFADGALELSLLREDHGNAATVSGQLRNRGASPVFVEGVEFSFVFDGHGHEDLRFLRHGWQSWSPTGVRTLDSAGEAAFPSGSWLRGMYHSQGEGRPGWHESETLTVVGGTASGPFCLVGALETGRQFGVLRLRPGPRADRGHRVEIGLELRLEVALEPGETRELEAFRVALGEEVNPLLERFAELWGTVGGARRGAPFQAGWCSWYHFFHRVSEDDLRRNLEGLASDRDGIPVDVVQLDDGFQLAVGDWLEAGANFPSGLPALAGAIREAGFRAGIWTAPFAASAESRVLGAHPDWTLRDGELPLRGSYNPEWSQDGWVYVLDPTRPEVQGHLEETFRSLVAMGFDYLKLDFLFMPAMGGRAFDPGRSRAERLRAGLEAIRRGAGDEAFLLGCGCPLGPAVGIVDGMRIGPDVAPSWGVEQPVVIPGLEEMLPSTRTALRSVFARQFLHRRLWLNDPDCLMVRRRETSLKGEEAASLATGIALSGGMVVFSDDVPGLEERERAAIAEVVQLASRIDAAAPRGCARATWPQDADGPCVIEASTGGGAWRGAVNLGDEVERVAGAAGSVRLRGGAFSELPAESPPGGEPFALNPHASALFRVPTAARPAVFCDFDGTFSQRDVGSALAQEYLSGLRVDLQQRYERGELGAWDYALELFEGFKFAPDKLDAFLSGIDLDPGAAALVAWCEARGVPFQILSDGFDYNLERLQEIHRVRFAFAANRLSFVADRWRIEPGGLNPDCECGTGNCKRAIIERYRRDHPGAYCIHIGDGRVSDLCAAEAADLVFAKGTLVDALRVRGIHYRRFQTLDGVREELEKSLVHLPGADPGGALPSGDVRR
jgi:alpha-galactosidase